MGGAGPGGRGVTSLYCRCIRSLSVGGAGPGGGERPVSTVGV